MVVKIRNNETVRLSDISVLPYDKFYSAVSTQLGLEAVHCTAYFAFPLPGELQFLCVLANDELGLLSLYSHKREQEDKKPIKSLTAVFPAMHVFERLLREKHGIEFSDHPWLKPVRYSKMYDYPFYRIESEELHEVGVGPIHAGVIEPGHFRFICNGETVLHLEIQLGWQHRGMEKAMTEGKTLLGRTVLAEQIAGDTAVGHSLAFAHAMESLGGVEISGELERERCIALELERIAVHTGDMGALCTDIAYQLGSAVFGVLRTPVINFIQQWCGNRLGKSLIRIGGSWAPLTVELKERLLAVLEDFEWRFLEVAKDTRVMPGVENRFENIGTVSFDQVKKIGAVGMAARMSGLKRDIRATHPFSAYRTVAFSPVYLEKGDVLSRFLLRKFEVVKSIAFIRELLDGMPDKVEKPLEEVTMEPGTITVSLTEGWRGEICHTAVTDDSGELLCYDINDPSVHNWKALELSLRNLEISDFPINNKSYNLSYCGHDL